MLCETLQRAGPIQPATTGAIRLEHTTLQSDLTKFEGLMEDLHRAQAQETVSQEHSASFGLMCELNELRDLPYHSRREARMHCVQVTTGI